MNKVITLIKICLILAILPGVFLSGSLAVLAASSPDAPHYLEDALIEGRHVQRWNDYTTVLNVNIQSAPSLKGWSPKMTELVKSAFAEWEQAMGGRIRFVQTDSVVDTDIMVRWQQKSTGYEVGRQSYSWDGTNTLMNTDIDIAIRNPAGVRHSDKEIRTIALHEIGHALGIKGHSSNPRDIMYPTIHDKTYRLSSRDIATIKIIYKKKPDITNPIGVHFMQYQRFLYYARLGADAISEKRDVTAYQYFLKAQAYYPNDSRIPFLVGISALNINKYDVAIKNLEKAVSIKGKEQTNAEFFLASALMASGSNEISSGKEESGLKKLYKAHNHYNNVLKKPNIPAELRSIATNNISLIRSVTH